MALHLSVNFVIISLNAMYLYSLLIPSSDSSLAGRHRLKSGRKP